jgi:hypothetical protein
MLKLNHKAMSGPDVSNVPFLRVLIVLNKLLAFSRKMTFPRAMPIGFRLYPGIALTFAPVCPVRDPLRATFGNNVAITVGT